MAPVQAQVIECVFRERYSDFVVREVGPDGAARVVAEAPPADAPDEAPAEEEAAATAAGLAALAGGGADVVEAIERVLSGADPGPAALPPCSDKAARTAQHQYARRLGAATDTDGAGPAMHVRVWKAGGSRKGPRRRRPAGLAHVWPAGRPRFCRFALYKENCDTMAVVGAPRGPCGARRRAWATPGPRTAAPRRRSSRPRTERTPGRCPRRVARVARQFPAVRCGGFSYVGDALRLGDLSGNAPEVARGRARVAGGGREALAAGGRGRGAARRGARFRELLWPAALRDGGDVERDRRRGGPEGGDGPGEWKAVSDLILGARRATSRARSRPRRTTPRGVCEKRSTRCRGGSASNAGCWKDPCGTARTRTCRPLRRCPRTRGSCTGTRGGPASFAFFWNLSSGSDFDGRSCGTSHRARRPCPSWRSTGRTTLTIELDSEFTVITTLGTSRASSTRPRPRGRRGTASPSWSGTWCSSAAARVGGSPRTRPCASSARRTGRARDRRRGCRCRGTP